MRITLGAIIKNVPLMLCLGGTHASNSARFSWEHFILPELTPSFVERAAHNLHMEHPDHQKALHYLSSGIQEKSTYKMHIQSLQNLMKNDHTSQSGRYLALILEHHEKGNAYLNPLYLRSFQWSAEKGDLIAVHALIQLFRGLYRQDTLAVMYAKWADSLEQKLYAYQDVVEQHNNEIGPLEDTPPSLT